MARPVRLFILLALLSAVLLYAWLTNQATPAAPQGEFGGIILLCMVIGCLALIALLLLRMAFPLIRRSCQHWQQRSRGSIGNGAAGREGSFGQGNPQP